MSKHRDKAIIDIELSGSRWEDASRALTRLRLKTGEAAWLPPRGWVLHHTGQVGPGSNTSDGTIQVVPLALHATLPHAGGFDTGVAQVTGPAYAFGASPKPLSDTARSLSSAELDRFEELLEVKLPVDYRQFLLSTNGGVPRWRGWQSEDGCNQTLDHFLSLGSGSPYDIVSFFNDYGDRLPEDTLPVANDLFGNVLCLSLDPFEPGIWFWDHEREGEAHHRAAKSFTDLLSRFFELEI